MKTNGQISIWKNVQILHSDNFHWATVSSYLHRRHGTIDYYDRMVELRTILRYKFLTFASQTICHYK